MADPTPQRTPPSLLGEVNDGDTVIFRVVGESVFLTSGGPGVTGPTGAAGATGATGATGPTGPTGP